MGKGLVAELRKGEKWGRESPNNYVSVNAVQEQAVSFVMKSGH